MYEGMLVDVPHSHCGTYEVRGMEGVRVYDATRRGLESRAPETEHPLCLPELY